MTGPNWVSNLLQIFVILITLTIFKSNKLNSLVVRINCHIIMSLRDHHGSCHIHSHSTLRTQTMRKAGAKVRPHSFILLFFNDIP